MSVGDVVWYFVEIRLWPHGVAGEGALVEICCGVLTGCYLAVEVIAL
jgi:hypothetical protein